jgi:hypothetical protein
MDDTMVFHGVPLFFLSFFPVVIFSVVLCVHRSPLLRLAGGDVTVTLLSIAPT